jgi:hypothetical protein
VELEPWRRAFPRCFSQIEAAHSLAVTPSQIHISIAISQVSACIGIPPGMLTISAFNENLRTAYPTRGDRSRAAVFLRSFRIPSKRTFCRVSHGIHAASLS